jgi:hypothetical protein
MDQQASPHRPESTGGIATAEEGQVMLDGPNGVAVAMMPEAAEQAASQREADTKPD